MDQENLQTTPVTGMQPTSQDTSYTRRRVQTNPVRDHGLEKEGQRSRASSVAQSDMGSETSRYNRARVPINEAVHSALDPIDPNHTAISPEVLNQITSQITASVLQRLKESQFSPTATSVGVDPADSTSLTGDSPPIDRDKVYTPPSPYRASEEAAQTTSSASPRKQRDYQNTPDLRRPPSPPFSHGTMSDSDMRENTTRTAKAEDPITDSGETILEKIWGELFDGQGSPTKKLSQFLRGIAVHIIEDYEPKHSLVISPDKMQRYYEETKLSNEIYPWKVIFDDRTSSISRMFRDVEAQHHLTQDRLSERPDIPGLTPIGFETWMLLVLKAHPDEEFERLAYTALHMPVSNPDDRKERFPKELSRRQFHKDGDYDIASKLQQIMLTHCGVKIPSRNGSPSDKEKAAQPTTALPDDVSQQPAPSGPSLSKSTTRSSVSDADPATLRSTASGLANETSPIEVVPPPQIERERKPYVAQPGGGKNYDKVNPPVVQPAETKPTHPMPPPPSLLTRSSSLNNGRMPRASTRSAQPPISIHQKASQGPPPVVVPQPIRTRTGSVYHRDAARLDRNRSPSISRDKVVPPHKSDGEVTYGSYYPATSSDYTPGTWRPDNRNDHRSSYPGPVDVRDLSREPRQRYHSVSSTDGYRGYPKDYASDDEHYRTGNASSYPRSDLPYLPNQPCPPTSYRNRA